MSSPQPDPLGAPRAACLADVPLVRVAPLLARAERRVIDLRSPSEFADDHLPGAVNVPLFDDAERALVGTLYKQSSPSAAFEAGRSLVHKRIRGLVNEIAAAADRPAPAGEITALLDEMTESGLDGLQQGLRQSLAELPAGAPLVLHCWRGGMRSCSVIAFLRALGWHDVYGLEGGYKTYRRHVLAELEAWPAPPCFVLRGKTGVGKTLVLREVERLRPGWTVDLEALAGHRSSILGMVGLEPCTQKTFDSRLAARLGELDGPCVVFEGESRKVGDSIIARAPWEALQAGSNVWLEGSVAYRTRVLVDDYLASESSRAELRRQLPFIEQRLGAKAWDGELVARLDDGREAELVALLLEHYYDPLYRHSEAGRRYDLRLEVEDPAAAAREVVAWIEARLGGAATVADA
ncbi:MAG: tRNA 2-selenouridine(34) synthase MnmH [Planctomycetes bacterium]|nr:tRNA 2-selenouridine(34) synthase MnmH [Planctomycetota bacterium]